MSCWKRLYLIFLLVVSDCGGLLFSRSEARPVEVFRFDFPAAHGPDSAGCHWNQRACCGNRSDQVSWLS